MRFIRNIFNSRVPTCAAIQALAALMLRVASFTNWFNAGGVHGAGMFVNFRRNPVNHSRAQAYNQVCRNHPPRS